MALKRLRQIGTGIKSLPKAAEKFGETLVSEGRKDLAREGSSAQRFADAPLGQYYLPDKVQGALGFLAPSPRKVVRDTRNVSRNPSPGNIAAAGGNVLSLATLPLAGPQAFRAGRGAVAAVKSARAARPGGLVLSGSIKAASESARGALKELGAMDSVATGKPRSITSYMSSRFGDDVTSAAIAKSEAVGARASRIARMRTPVPKRGEEGWIRVHQGGQGVLLRMGKGKFPGEDKLAINTLAKTSTKDPGAGYYRATLSSGSTPNAVNVDYLKRVGDVNFNDLGREITAVQRALAARGINQIEATAASPSRKRLFDALLLRKGMKGTVKNPEIYREALRPKAVAPRPGLLGRVGSAAQRLHREETGAINLKRLKVSKGMPRPESFLMTDKDEFIRVGREETHMGELLKGYGRDMEAIVDKAIERSPSGLTPKRMSDQIHRIFSKHLKKGFVRVNQGETYMGVEAYDTKALRRLGAKLTADHPDSMSVYVDLHKVGDANLGFETGEVVGSLYPKTVKDLRRLATPRRLGGKKAPRTQFLDLWERVAKRERGE